MTLTPQQFSSVHPVTEDPGNPTGLPHRIPELLAPAGDWDCARAAVENGADAIYFGLNRFNARMRAQNFTEADLPDLMAFLHQRGVKGYVTLNTLIFTEELDAAESYLRTMIRAGVDAVIVQDVGICRLIRHLSPDFPIHASTQMTVTSAAGVEFVRNLGCQLVVLARECSLTDIQKIQASLNGSPFPLEIFVHGALCVAYSGQCLTSESLGGRSANRGECAQACRMPYDLIVDGEKVPLGDRQYLLSPQDLAGLDLLPQLVETGLVCFKIEGRLKSPEYVASVTGIYRQALDRVLAGSSRAVPPSQEKSTRYELEMSFSRGLYSGWLQGIDNQALVHARFGKKRGVFLGEVLTIQGDRIQISLEAPLKAGDGVVFDSGRPDQPEEGGRLYQVDQQGSMAVLRFGAGSLQFHRIHPGDRVWKTSDPEWERQVRQRLNPEQPQTHQPIQMEVHGSVGEPLTLIVRDGRGHVVQVESAMPLIAAQKQPLTAERLQDQLGRLGSTPFRLETLRADLNGSLMLPVSELNRLRREAVEKLQERLAQPLHWTLHDGSSYRDLAPMGQPAQTQSPQWIVLVRTLEQLDAARACGIQTLYCEFEDPRRYREAVTRVKTDPTVPGQTLWVVPPRITKPGETWILKQVKASQAHGYLVRNYDQLAFFAGERCIGDFSLNVANPLTAVHLMETYPLERLTASYDLNIQQLDHLISACPSDWLEVTIHQHMPMFHMEHCVFCAFLSSGTDYTNCGRPCEEGVVGLRDRVGETHLLKADSGCRNTLYNAKAQTGAEYVHHLVKRGLRHLRLEFLAEDPAQVQRTIRAYQGLLTGETRGSQLWKELQLINQLGVTRGQL